MFDWISPNQIDLHCVKATFKVTEIIILFNYTLFYCMGKKISILPLDGFIKLLLHKKLYWFSLQIRSLID